MRINTIDFSLPTVLKYLGAFAAGFIASVLPVLYTGVLPNQPQLIVAFAVGLGGTGLLHIVPPRAKAAVTLSQQPVVAAGSLPDSMQVIAAPKP